MMDLIELAVDSGFDSDSIERAELAWANLPTGRAWSSLATHEKALVVHTLSRLAPQSFDEEIVARVARAICIGVGEDPDAIVTAGNPIGEPADYPCWMLWLPDARAALSAVPTPEL